MTSRGVKYVSKNDEEKTKLLSDDIFQDDYEVQFSKDSYVESKKRTRKLSDEPYALIDVGDTPKSPPLDQCVETEVQPGDTLAKLSLKYSIPVAELKRVNNILSDQYFYALKRIKIPVRTASLLTELLPSVHEANGESKLENGWYVRDVPSPILSGGTSSTVPSTPASDGEHEIVSLNGGIQNQSPPINTSETSKQTRKAKKLLGKFDKDLARIKERLPGDDDDDDEDVSLVPTTPDVLRSSSSGSKPGFVDSIRASQSRTACCLFAVIISVVIIFILIFAHTEYGIVKEHKHDLIHHQQPHVGAGSPQSSQ